VRGDSYTLGGVGGVSVGAARCDVRMGGKGRPRARAAPRLPDGLMLLQLLHTCSAAAEAAAGAAAGGATAPSGLPPQPTVASLTLPPTRHHIQAAVSSLSQTESAVAAA
jgi:hypothetical protein